MPFLTLNGVTIPTKSGGEIKVTEYGERTAGYDGSAQIDVRSRKREWQFTTKPISHVRARAIEGLVQGNGLYLPWGASTGVYAANGTYPTTVQGGTAIPAVGADGAVSFDEQGARGALVGASSLSFDPPSTNIASAAVASCSSTTGWTQASGSNATYAVDTAHFWDGANSVKITQSAAFAGILTPTFTANPSSTYTISCYVYSASACTFQISGVFTNTSSSTSYGYNPSTANHPGGGWKRFYTNVLTQSNTNAVGLALVIPSASGVIGPLWLDAIQIETPNYNNQPTAWQTGATSRSGSIYEYPFNYSNPTGLTFSCWYAGNFGNAAGGASDLVSFFDSAGNRPFYVDLFNGGACTLSVNTGTGGAAVTSFIPQNVGNWTHLVVTYNGSPYTNSAGTTFPNLNVYVGGNLANSNTATGVINTPVKVDVGSVYGSYWFLGRLDDVQILPYGVDANWVAQTYAASQNAYVQQTGITGLTPFIAMAGDAIDGAPVMVHGSVKQSTYVGFQDPVYGWISQGRQLQILLTEV